MFYTEKPSNALRFGDILKGYCHTTAVIEKPILDGRFSKYDISVDFPSFSVLMSPCCQIERKTITISPLISIRAAFFENPYLAADLTRINRKMTSQQSVPPQAWESMGEEERQRRENKGLAYAFPYAFVFEKHAQLPEYQLLNRQGDIITTRYYMVDFKDLTKVSCEEIKTSKDVPVYSKMLELSVETRKELGDKLASYYGTLAPEDIALLEAT
jgi:hypothetical protein